MRRVVEQGNVRKVQEFIGDPGKPAEMDDPRKWADLVELHDDEGYGGWIKLATDIAVAVNPRGGLVLNLGGLRVGIHEDHVEEALLSLGDAVVEARAARQNAKTAREAAQAIAAAARRRAPEAGNGG